VLLHDRDQAARQGFGNCDRCTSSILLTGCLTEKNQPSIYFLISSR
jgi:hypothetical protein